MRAFLDCEVAVGQFIVAELAELGGQSGVAILQFLDLAGIVLLDHRFDSLGAGMGGLVAQEGGASAQGEGGRAPDRRHQGRTHAALGQQFVEARQVDLLVALHLAQLVGDAFAARRGAHHRRLAAIDMNGRQFARLVDAQDLGEARRGRR